MINLLEASFSHFSHVLWFFPSNTYQIVQKNIMDCHRLRISEINSKRLKNQVSYGSGRLNSGAAISMFFKLAKNIRHPRYFVFSFCMENLQSFE